MVIALMFGVLLLPIMINYHHISLVAAWNMAFMVGFLPGTPKIWYLLALLSLCFTLAARAINKRRMLSYKPLSYCMLAIGGVAIFTGVLRGGVGMRAMGSEMYGGKSFAYIILAIIGYFALSSVKIPKRKVLIYVLLFFLGTLTLISSNLVYLLGPQFWYLYLFVPVDYAVGQAQADFLKSEVVRYGGVGFALMGVYFYMMIRYGIRGILDFRYLWRIIILLMVIAGSLVGGFRSTLIIYILIFAIQFFLEGLHKTKYLWGIIGAAIIGVSFLYPFAKELPFSIQRSLSFMPGLQIDLAAKADADASIEWRLKIWSVMWPQVGNYLLLGKGFVYDSSDIYLAQESIKRGFMQTEDYAVIVGDYHNGPLSILIPLGIWGLLAFIALNIVGLRMLYLFYKNGDPDLYMFNQGMLALFIARLVYFWLFFGAVASDMAIFAGILGLSLAVNGPPRNTPWNPEEEERELYDESEEVPAQLPSNSKTPALPVETELIRH